MTSNHVIVAIKLCRDAGNDEYIILCSFCSRTMSSFEVIEGGLRAPLSPTHPPLGRRKPKKIGLNGLLNEYLF